MVTQVSAFLDTGNVFLSIVMTTVGAMDATNESVYSNAVEWYRGRGFWFDPPLVRFKNKEAFISLEGEQWQNQASTEIRFASIQAVYDVETRLQSPLASVYKKHILEHLSEALNEDKDSAFGALVQEPVLLGAGGMLYVDPLFQRVLVDTVRSEDYASLLPPVNAADSTSWRNIPVIFDEVFTGLHRVGPLTPSSILGCHPDIACYAKILTGGLLPLSITLASQSIYDTFLSESKVDALLHGHSYTAYPAACAVANKTLEMITSLDWSAPMADWRQNESKNTIFSLWSRSVLHDLSVRDSVKSAMSLGTVLSVELHDNQTSGELNVGFGLVKCRRIAY